MWSVYQKGEPISRADISASWTRLHTVTPDCRKKATKRPLNPEDNCPAADGEATSQLLICPRFCDRDYFASGCLSCRPAANGEAASRLLICPRFYGRDYFTSGCLVCGPAW